MTRNDIINGLEHCTVQAVDRDCDSCPVGFGEACALNLKRAALELLKAHEPADSIPIDWLMNYAQLPTEFAISAWRKPKKEAEIKQAKSIDKPMSLDDALGLLKAQEPVEPKWRKGYAYCGQCGYKLHWIVEQNNFCPNCGKVVKWE